MAPENLRQWVTKQDGLDNLQIATAVMPNPKEGEVLVKIGTVSLNYRDTEGISSVIPSFKTISTKRSLKL